MRSAGDSKTFRLAINPQETFMNTRFDRTTTARWAPFRRAAGVVLSTLLLAPCIANSAPTHPVGFKVLLQPWEPRTDNDAVTTVIDSNDAISAGLSHAWAQSKPAIIESLKKGLGKGDLIAKGVSLYNIDIRLNEPELRVAAGPGDVLKATLTLPNSYLVATATQPSIFGSYADPRCSLHFTVDVTVPIRINDVPSRLLQSAFGPNDHVVTVRDFSADAENAVCGFAKLILSTVGIWQKFTNAINDPNLPQYRQLNDALKRGVDSALASINGRIAVPTKFVRLKVWPNSTKTTVLFGVREQSVPSKNTGVVSGRLTVGDLKGLSLPIERCNQLEPTLKVKTGPRVVLTPAGELGDAPMRAMATQMTGGAVSGANSPEAAMGANCQYALEGLVTGFPNFVTFHVANHSRPSSHGVNPTVRPFIDVVPQGWRFDSALHPNATGHDVTLVAAVHGSPGVHQQAVVGRHKPGDPVEASVAAQRAHPGVKQANPGMAQIGISQAAKGPTPSIQAATVNVASALRQQQTVSTSTPQWGAASLIQRTTPAETNQSVTQASSTSAHKAPTSAFIR
jgi:hypothetical protein